LFPIIALSLLQRDENIKKWGKMEGWWRRKMASCMQSICHRNIKNGCIFHSKKNEIFALFEKLGSKTTMCPMMQNIVLQESNKDYFRGHKGFSRKKKTFDSKKKLFTF
jgi:hypothetical protein